MTKVEVTVLKTNITSATEDQCGVEGRNSSIFN